MVSGLVNQTAVLKEEEHSVAVTIDTSSDFGAKVAQRVESETLIWLTTVDSAGTPQPNPVRF